MGSSALDVEDEFKSLYGVTSVAEVMEPPFNLRYLETLVQTNNALGPCIDAMVTNIDGTGWVVNARDAETVDGVKAEIENVTAFFKEPWPGTSFTSMRKDLRRDLESTGNTYIEVMRNPKNEVVMMRHLNSKLMRLIGFGAPIEVTKTVVRNGQEMSTQVAVRQRRFVQVIGGRNWVYFKEFGAALEVNKRTGAWVPEDEEPIPFKERGTEIIHLKLMPDIGTAYGVPRWIAQVPSVLGSRKAEEHNLDFFDSGGVPPVLVLVQGGVLATRAKEAINKFLNAGKGQQHRAAVVEAHSMERSTDGSGTNNIRITVERFGAERQKDSMFEKYDAFSEKRVRRSFRLPPIFVGLAEDYSFATAFASYTVAEAQVFLPERDEFDEIVNLLLMPVLTKAAGKILFRSLPTQVKDTTQQLEGVKLLTDHGAMDKGTLVDTVNQIVTLDIKVIEGQAEEVAQGAGAMAGTPGPDAATNAPPGAPSGDEATPGKNPTPGKPAATKMAMDATGLVELADEVVSLLAKGQAGDEAFRQVMENVGELPAADMKAFRGILATKAFINPEVDPDGLAVIGGCALAIMAGGRSVH